MGVQGFHSIPYKVPSNATRLPRLNPQGVEEAKVIEGRYEDDVLAADPVTKFSMPYRPAFW